MQQTEGSDKGKDALQHQNDQRLTEKGTSVNWLALNWRMMTLVGGLTVAGGSGVALLLWLANVIDDLGQALGFVAQNTLSWFIFLALIVQVVINQKQWDAMQAALKIERAKTDPRLRVSKIRMENFQVGLSPIFITTIANDGFIDATGVELHIGIKFGDDRKFNWIAPQVVTIPARGQESYPIFSGAFFSEEDFNGFNTNKLPIEVSVEVRYWPGSPTEPQRFCYRYLPWYGGQRPDDIPQFVPCDFNPRLNITLKVGGATMKHMAQHVTVTTGKRNQSDVQPSGDPGLEQITKAETENEGEDKRENPN